MADLSRVFGLIRVIILLIVTLFSALVLIMAALVTDFSTSRLRLYFDFAAFAIAISCLTLLTVPVMIFLSINRKGAFPSMIAVELGYFGLLWVLWLAVGGTIGGSYLIGVCSALSYYYRGYEAVCMETQAMAGFSFLNWLLLMVLDFSLLTLAIMQANRGNSAIWTSCVTEVDYSAPAASAGTLEPKAAYGSPAFQVTPIPQQYSQSIQTPQPAYPPQQMYTPPQQMYTPPPQQHAMPMSAQV